MHALIQATGWTLLGIGLVLLGVGVATLVRRQVVFPWLHRRDWKREGWAEVLISLFIVIETVPRLANVSPALVLGLTPAALLLLAGGAVLRGRARQPH